MRDINRLFVAVAAVTMLAATGPVVAGSPKGVCQAGGANTAVLEKAQLQYWQWWYFGIGSQEATGACSLRLPLPPPETARRLADALSVIADSLRRTRAGE